MTAKLFRNSMAVAVSVMALSIILFMGVLYQYFSDQMMEALGTETWLVARGVELEGLNYLDGLDSENRVTWVAADGTVLFDSSTDSAAMENHGNREEIREAQENRLGAATRYSSTLAEQTLYSARRLSDGTVIRLASSQRTVWLLLLSMVQPILVILVLALLLSVVLASRLSRSIIRPIAELDLEHPEDCDAYDELAPLLTRIKRQNDTIKQQMGQLQQKQTEFSALTENMAEGFLLLDRQGRVLSHNPGALRLLGAEEPVGEVNALFLNREEHFRQAVAPREGSVPDGSHHLGGAPEPTGAPDEWAVLPAAGRPGMEGRGAGGSGPGADGRHRAGEAGGTAAGVHRQCFP